jgi:GDPmannose 4,6-dehydratase
VRALVTGAAGQDGTLLRRLLEAEGVEVLGLDARQPDASSDRGPVSVLDITDRNAFARVIASFRPDEIYHLAACHHSSEKEGGRPLDARMIATNFATTEVIVTTVAEQFPTCRILFAGTSQMYTPGISAPVTEATPMAPATFYGLTKSWSRQLLSFYREQRGLFCSTVILFNHESPLRGPEFLTRKITLAAARASRTGQSDLHLRDVTAQVDWSSARDIVRGMRLALSVSTPRDFVLASGEAHSVRDVLDVAFGYVGLDWREYTRYDPPPAHPSTPLVGDPSRIETEAGWRREKTFQSMIEEMVMEDLSLSPQAHSFQ